MPHREPVVVHEADCPVESWDDASRGTTRWKTLLSADRTDSSGMTLGIAEVEAGDGHSPPLHRHAPPELYYVLTGQGVVHVDGTERAVRAGSAVFVPGNARHQLRNTGSGTLRLLYAFPVDSFDQVEYEF